jgi:hypothetical protein
MKKKKLSKKELIKKIQNNMHIKDMWIKSEIENIPNLPQDVLEEIYQELYTK